MTTARSAGMRQVVGGKKVTSCPCARGKGADRAGIRRRQPSSPTPTHLQHPQSVPLHPSPSLTISSSNPPFTLLASALKDTRLGPWIPLSPARPSVTSLDASASLFLVVVKASLAVGQRDESQRNLKVEILPPASFPSTSNLHKPSEDPWNDYHKATAVDATPARVAKHPTFGVRSPVVSVVKDFVEGCELPSPLQPFSHSEASRLLEQTSCSLRRPGGSKRCTAENRFDSEGVTE